MNRIVIECISDRLALAHHRLFHRLGMQRKTPRVASCVSLRHRDLLLLSFQVP